MQNYADDELVLSYVNQTESEIKLVTQALKQEYLRLGHMGPRSLSNILTSNFCALIEFNFYFIENSI